jgi:hypothetical protein
MKYINHNNETYVSLNDILNSLGNAYKNGFLSEVDGQSEEAIVSHLEKRMVNLSSYLNLSNNEE